MNALYLLFFHPELGDNGSGPVVILIFVLYLPGGAALVCGAVYLIWKLFARVKGR